MGPEMEVMGGEAEGAKREQEEVTAAQGSLYSARPHQLLHQQVPAYSQRSLNNQTFNVEGNQNRACVVKSSQNIQDSPRHMIATID